MYMNTPFKCSPEVVNCKAECCGCFPMSVELLEQFDSFKQVQVQSIYYYTIDKLSMALTKDEYCVFLNREIFKCMIYENRPAICRKYGTTEELPCCYFGVNGERRTRAGRRRARRIISKNVLGSIKKLKTTAWRVSHELRAV